jgi:hypothetical protein
MFTFNVHECGVQLNMMGHISVSSCHNNMLSRHRDITAPFSLVAVVWFMYCEA